MDTKHVKNDNYIFTVSADEHFNNSDTEQKKVNRIFGHSFTTIDSSDDSDESLQCESSGSNTAQLSEDDCIDGDLDKPRLLRTDTMTTEKEDYGLQYEKETKELYPDTKATLSDENILDDKEQDQNTVDRLRQTFEDKNNLKVEGLLWSWFVIMAFFFLYMKWQESQYESLRYCKLPS